MKIALMALIVLSLTLCRSWADGIPFDKKTQRVTEPHVTLTLDEKQRLELIFSSQITLTPAQHKRLTKQCPGFPDTLHSILSYRHGDCTCFVGRPYAILLPGCTSVAVTREEMDNFTANGASAPHVPPAAEKRQSGWSHFWENLFGSKNS